jgi:hypothetical protein
MLELLIKTFPEFSAIDRILVFKVRKESEYGFSDYQILKIDFFH